MVSFRGGVRGGIDRDYKSDVKTYTQSTATSDAVVGVQSIMDNGDKLTDYWIIPTIYIDFLRQKSISVNKIRLAKNNWELMENCKDADFVMSTFCPDGKLF